MKRPFHDKAEDYLFKLDQKRWIRQFKEEKMEKLTQSTSHSLTNLILGANVSSLPCSPPNLLLTNLKRLNGKKTIIDPELLDPLTRVYESKITSLSRDLRVLENELSLMARSIESLVDENEHLRNALEAELAREDLQTRGLKALAWEVQRRQEDMQKEIGERGKKECEELAGLKESSRGLEAEVRRKNERIEALEACLRRKEIQSEQKSKLNGNECEVCRIESGKRRTRQWEISQILQFTFLAERTGKWRIKKRFGKCEKGQRSASSSGNRFVGRVAAKRVQMANKGKGRDLGILEKTRVHLKRPEIRENEYKIKTKNTNAQENDHFDLKIRQAKANIEQSNTKIIESNFENMTKHDVKTKTTKRHLLESKKTIAKCAANSSPRGRDNRPRRYVSLVKKATKPKEQMIPKNKVFYSDAKNDNKSRHDLRQTGHEGGRTLSPIQRDIYRQKIQTPDQRIRKFKLEKYTDPFRETGEWSQSSRSSVYNRGARRVEASSSLIDFYKQNNSQRVSGTELILNSIKQLRKK